MNKTANFLRESGMARFLIPSGILFIVFGIIFFIASTNNKDFIEIESTVSNVRVAEESYIDTDGNRVEATYEVNVKYTVDGKEYESELSGVSKYKIGDKMTIYYNPSNPSQITQTKSLIVPIIIIAVGIASLVGGIVSVMNAIKRCKKMKEQEKGW